MNIIETYFAYKLFINIGFSVCIALFLLFAFAYHLYDERKYKRNGKARRK